MTFIRYLCTLLLALAGTGVGAALAQDVRGYVQELDATKGVITLTFFLRGQVSVKSFSLSKPDIPVVNPAGQALKLSDVQAESLVTLEFNAEGDVVSILAPLPTVHGPLTDVDAKKREIVLKVLTGPRTIALAPATKIYLDGEPAALKDLAVGALTRVTFTPDRESVFEVRAGKGVNHPKPMKRMGVLIEIDAKNRLARYFASSPFGDVSMLRDVPLANDATFSLCYQHRPIRTLQLAEITKGYQTFYWVEPVHKKVVHMDVEMPLLARRTVKALDPEKGSLTIVENEVEKVLTLSPKVKVLGPAGPGKLADVVPGMSVDCGLHPDRKHVELLVAPSQRPLKN
jgi:hypothetical protein